MREGKDTRVMTHGGVMRTFLLDTRFAFAAAGAVFAAAVALFAFNGNPTVHNGPDRKAHIILTVHSAQ